MKSSLSNRYQVRKLLNFIGTFVSTISKMENQENQIVLKFSRTSDNAYAPVKGSQKAAGFDLRSANATVVPARGKQLVSTDLKIELPPGCYGRIAPRSGLALKNFIDVGAGVIDEDYRGNVGIVLFNHSDEDFIINRGDRVAQLICEKIYSPVLMEIENVNTTQRGTDGFGSTGIQ